MLGLPAVAVSQQSTAREMDFRLGRQFDFEHRGAFTARVVEEIEDVPLPGGTLLNINVPAGEVLGRRGRPAGQAHLPRPARAPGRAVRPPPVPDLRRRARLPARGGHRPRRGRRGPHRGHAAALRPHGRAGHRDAAGVRPRPPAAAGGAKRSGDADATGDERGGRPRRRAPRPARVPRAPLLRPRRPRDRRRRVRRAARRAAPDRGRAPGARHARLADPAGRRRARLASSTRSATSSRCSRSPTCARRRSCARGWRGCARTSPARGSRTRRSPTSRSRRSTAWRSRCVYRDGVLRARRHPRQRRGRRGRHPQPAHGRRDPAADRRRAAAGRGPRRGLHVAARLPGAQRAPRRGRGCRRS